MLKLDNISFSYRGKRILSNISLELLRGSIAALTGPSGGGKSTLFQLIAGILKPDCGTIFIDAPGSSKMAYMFQEENLLPWRTLLENVLLLPELYSLPKKKWIEPAKALLDEVGLFEYKNYYPSEISGGMRKRAALAAALLLDPPLLLLDEPFSAIDLFRKKSLYRLIRSLQKKRNLTIFFITHQFEDISALAEEVYLLHQGAIFKGSGVEEMGSILDQVVVSEEELV